MRNNKNSNFVVCFLTFISILAFTNCSRQPLTPMTGTGDGTTSNDGGGDTWNGGDTDTPIPGSNVNKAGDGASDTCNGAQCTAFDVPDAEDVNRGTHVTNPAPGASSVPGDLNNKISDLLEKAREDGPNAVLNTNCDPSSSSCFNRVTLGNQILAACITGLDRFAPRPGETLLGRWKTAAGGRSFMADVTGSYPTYHLKWTVAGLPNWPKRQDIKMTTNNSLTAQGKKAALRWNWLLMDEPTFGSGAVHYKNPASGAHGDRVITLIQPNNPIPDRTTQGVRSVGDCYRKALFLTSPLFDTMYKSMGNDKATNLLESFLVTY